MRNKLTVFKDNYVINKAELLYDLKQFAEHFRNVGEEELRFERKAIFDKLQEFIEQVKNLKLPDLDHWWFYSYQIGNFDIKLQMCYCEEIEYDEEGYVKEMTSTAMYTLFSLTCKMLTVNEFALLHNVRPQTVRQWIRQGKLRAIRKQGRDWFISEFSKAPARKYESVTYYWKKEKQWNAEFSYLNHYDCIYLYQNKKNKGEFCGILGCFQEDRKEIVLTNTEREKLEYHLLSCSEVTAEESSSRVYYWPPKESDNRIYAEDRQGREKLNEVSFGQVRITRGEHKGRIGNFDDFEEGKAIVYFGNPYLTDKFYRISLNNISGTIPTVALMSRLDEIAGEVIRYRYDGNLQKDLLNEYIYCSDLLNERYIKAMNKLSEDSKIQIFISHATYDMPFAKTLATDLLEEGYKVFLDEWSIEIGDRLHDKINDGLDNCDALVMIISEHYLKSVYCKDEWSAFYKRAAANRKCMIYPIIIDGSEPPALISTIKYARVDAFGSYEDNLNKLLKALKSHYKS